MLQRRRDSPRRHDRSLRWPRSGRGLLAYEIRGNEPTTKRIAAKNPAEMRAGNYLTFMFRLEGRDKLWLTSKTDENGPLATPTTVKLTRLE
jgi:hypothetical protein